MRFAAVPIALITLVITGCNGNNVVGDPQPSPTPTLAPTPTPTAAPTATPLLCKFYGVDDVSNLWVIDPIAVTATLVGPTGQNSMTDIAITPDNRIITITASGAWQLDPSTGAATSLTTTVWIDSQDALDALPNGQILVGGGASLASVDLSTGVKTSLGSMASGWAFSGDVASSIDGQSAVATATTGSGNDHLFSFDLATQTATDVGDLGYQKVFGLDYGCDGSLYGMIATSPPKLIKVDAATAASTMLGTLTNGPSTLWGAAGPAVPGTGD